MTKINVTQEHWKRKEDYSHIKGCLLYQAFSDKFGKNITVRVNNFTLQSIKTIEFSNAVAFHVQHLYEGMVNFEPFSFYIDYGDEVELDETKLHQITINEEVS